MLTLQEIGISVDNKQVVDKISLALNPGTIHALMGPNGSGKSSLSLTLAGHPAYSLSASSKILLDDHDLTGLSPDERAQHGLFLSFQNPVAIPGLTVKQLLKLLSDHLRPDKPSVTELLTEIKQYADMVHIKPGLLERSVNDNFSGGEKKRIEMLQMLVARPKYALIDEVDSGLDIDAIKAAAAAIVLAKKEFNTGFLVITHYRRILDHLHPNQVHVMANGQLRQSGDQALIDRVEKEGYVGIL